MKQLLIISTLAALAALFPYAVAAENAVPVRDAWYRSAPARVVVEPPYRTQRDGSQYARSNCGPAVLGMVLDGYGITQPTLDLRRLTHTYQGTWPGRGGTALHHMARVAEDFGLRSFGLYDGSGEFRRWSVAEIAEQVSLGRWVIPLVRYGLLPGHEASGVRWGHYIVLYAEQDDGFLYHDPAFDPVEAGRARWISLENLDRAMAPVYPARQAVAIGG
jgi:hypothetical protein